VKVTVDRDACISSGICALDAPRLFDQDDEGVVLLLTDSPAAEDEQLARDAALGCPASAISVTEVE
jgi:ferredoxin